MAVISPDELKNLAEFRKLELSVLSVLKKEEWLSWAMQFLLPEIDKLLKNTVKTNPNSLSTTISISLRKEKEIKPYMFPFIKENLPGYKLIYGDKPSYDSQYQEYFFPLTISWE
jgi:hypothetical protein